jgi:hypothetical protein
VSLPVGGIPFWDRVREAGQGEVTWAEQDGVDVTELARSALAHGFPAAPGAGAGDAVAGHSERLVRRYECCAVDADTDGVVMHGVWCSQFHGDQ